MQPYLDFAKTLARDAGAQLLTWYEREFEVTTKSSEFDLVTEADRDAEALILDRIGTTFPDHTILSEEAGETARGSGFRWIVDPLDGTTNFAQGFPHFCVSIALQAAGETIVGAIFDPLRDELFWGASGAGAWLDSGRAGQHRLHVSDTDRLGAALLATGFAYNRAHAEINNIAEFTRIIRRIRGIRRAGSAALDLAYVAAGRVDGYWEYFMRPWDTAAGALLVQEAGGILSQISSDPWDPWQMSTVAANPALLPVLLAALRGEN